jgi:hypothetical protein
MVIYLLLFIFVIVIILCTCKENFTNIIIRPLDFVKYDKTGCENNLLKNVPGAKFCNDKISKFYDMRPILQYDNYYDMLHSLIIKISNPLNLEDNELIEDEDCNVADYEISNLIKKNIADVIINNHEFNNNGSFNLENITVIDPDLKYYKDVKSHKFIKVLFNIYDITRSSSTQAYCIVSNINNILNIEKAGLVYPNVDTRDEVNELQPKQDFRIYDSLAKINLSSYVNVSKNTNIEGGVSSDIEQIIDKYYS